nr:hypothetical protein [Tanacetum cinerariifolium]
MSVAGLRWQPAGDDGEVVWWSGEDCGGAGCGWRRGVRWRWGSDGEAAMVRMAAAAGDGWGDEGGESVVGDVDRDGGVVTVEVWQP